MLHFELGPSKRIFRDSNPDLRCVTITLNTHGSIANDLALKVHASSDRRLEDTPQSGSSFLKAMDLV
jgi:hypothetical protein